MTKPSKNAPTMALARQGYTKATQQIQQNFRRSQKTFAETRKAIFQNLQEFYRSSPFHVAVLENVQIVDISEGLVRLEFKVEKKHLNMHSTLHGGVSDTIADIAMAIATLTLVDTDKYTIVRSEQHIKNIAPAFLDDDLEVIAEVLSHGTLEPSIVSKKGRTKPFITHIRIVRRSDRVEVVEGNGAYPILPKLELASILGSQILGSQTVPTSSSCSISLKQTAVQDEVQNEQVRNDETEKTHLPHLPYEKLTHHKTKEMAISLLEKALEKVQKDVSAGVMSFYVSYYIAINIADLSLSINCYKFSCFVGIRATVPDNERNMSVPVVDRRFRRFSTDEQNRKAYKLCKEIYELCLWAKEKRENQREKALSSAAHKKLQTAVCVSN